jgi:lipopolysaccharide export system protein LptC
VAIILGGFAAGGCLPRPPPAIEQPRPEIELQGVRVRLYRSATLAASGNAASAAYDRQGGLGTGQIVTFHFPPSGRGLAEGGRAAKGVDVDARDVVGNLHSQIADASGEVTLRTGLGDRAVTPTAHYEGSSRSVSGHDGVTIVGPNYRLAAPRFRMTLADEHLELSGGVEGRAEGTR